MDKQMKVEIIGRETIKPSSLTPDHLKNYKLSLIDQVTPNIDVPMILFYPISDGLVQANFVSERSNHLKTSLSQTLSQFYPFAGRLQNNFWVDCNDDGVDYIQAKVNCPISKVLEKPYPDMLKLLLPVYVVSKEIVRTPLLLVQVNFFECGGMAIGLSISHKIADASTLSTFINNWAATSLASSELVLPIFGGASHFPPLDFLSSQPTGIKSHDDLDKCSTRRYVFDASKIATLQSKAASTTVPNPTRVEAVSALIWKSAMEASRSNLGYPRPSVLCHVVNTRKRLVPPLPENLMGNLVGFYTSKTEEIQINLQELVAKLRRGMEEVCENYKTGVGWEEIQQGLVEYGSLIKIKDIDCYSCTSWCRFPLYDANFGWGKPTWVSVASVTLNNVIQLMDTKDGGGIEAWLVFKDEDVALIESNEELQTFAHLNPSIL